MDKANKVSPKTNSLEATERSFTKTPTIKRPSGLNNSVRASSVLLQFDNEIILVAQGIERYLLKHPGAANSLESVVKRWIACQCFEESYDHVQQALDFLVAQGRIVKIKNVNGTYIYKKAEKVKNPPVEPLALQPECRFQRRPPIGALINPKFEARNSARSEASALNNDQKPKALMIKTVTCCFIGRKYLFGTFSHLIFAFVSKLALTLHCVLIFDIRILWLFFLSTSKAGGFWT